MSEKREPAADQKPGTGVDRTQIRELLAVPTAERIRMLVVEVRNLEELMSRIRIR